MTQEGFYQAQIQRILLNAEELINDPGWKEYFEKELPTLVLNATEEISGFTTESFRQAHKENKDRAPRPVLFNEYEYMMNGLVLKFPTNDNVKPAEALEFAATQTYALRVYEASSIKNWVTPDRLMEVKTDDFGSYESTGGTLDAGFTDVGYRTLDQKNQAIGDIIDKDVLVYHMPKQASTYEIEEMMKDPKFGKLIRYWIVNFRWMKYGTEDSIRDSYLTQFLNKRPEGTRFFRSVPPTYLQENLGEAFNDFTKAFLTTNDASDPSGQSAGMVRQHYELNRDYYGNYAGGIENVPDYTETTHRVYCQMLAGYADVVKAPDRPTFAMWKEMINKDTGRSNGFIDSTLISPKEPPQELRDARDGATRNWGRFQERFFTNSPKKGIDYYIQSRNTKQRQLDARLQMEREGIANPQFNNQSFTNMMAGLRKDLQRLNRIIQLNTDLSAAFENAERALYAASRWTPEELEDQKERKRIAQYDLSIAEWDRTNSPLNNAFNDDIPIGRYEYSTQVNGDLPANLVQALRDTYAIPLHRHQLQKGSPILHQYHTQMDGIVKRLQANNYALYNMIVSKFRQNGQEQEEAIFRQKVIRLRQFKDEHIPRLYAMDAEMKRKVFVIGEEGYPTDTIGMLDYERWWGVSYKQLDENKDKFEELHRKRQKKREEGRFAGEDLAQYKELRKYLLDLLKKVGRARADGGRDDALAVEERDSDDDNSDDDELNPALIDDDEIDIPELATNLHYNQLEWRGAQLGDNREGLVVGVPTERKESKFMTHRIVEVPPNDYNGGGMGEETLPYDNIPKPLDADEIQELFGQPFRNRYTGSLIAPGFESKSRDRASDIISESLNKASDGGEETSYYAEQELRKLNRKPFFKKDMDALNCPGINQVPDDVKNRLAFCSSEKIFYNARVLLMRYREYKKLNSRKFAKEWFDLYKRDREGAGRRSERKAIKKWHQYILAEIERVRALPNGDYDQQQALIKLIRAKHELFNTWVVITPPTTQGTSQAAQIVQRAEIVGREALDYLQSFNEKKWNSVFGAGHIDMENLTPAALAAISQQSTIYFGFRRIDRWPPPHNDPDDPDHKLAIFSDAHRRGDQYPLCFSVPTFLKCNERIFKPGTRHNGNFYPDGKCINKVEVIQPMVIEQASDDEEEGEEVKRYEPAPQRVITIGDEYCDFDLPTEAECNRLCFTYWTPEQLRALFKITIAMNNTKLMDVFSRRHRNHKFTYKHKYEFSFELDKTLDERSNAMRPNLGRPYHIMFDKTVEQVGRREQRFPPGHPCHDESAGPAPETPIPSAAPPAAAAGGGGKAKPKRPRKKAKPKTTGVSDPGGAAASGGGGKAKAKAKAKSKAKKSKTVSEAAILRVVTKQEYTDHKLLVDFIFQQSTAKGKFAVCFRLVFDGIDDTKKGAGGTGKTTGLGIQKAMGSIDFNRDLNDLRMQGRTATNDEIFKEKFQNRFGEDGNRDPTKLEVPQRWFFEAMTRLEDTFEIAFSEDDLTALYNICIDTVKRGGRGKKLSNLMADESREKFIGVLKDIVTRQRGQRFAAEVDHVADEVGSGGFGGKGGGKGSGKGGGKGGSSASASAAPPQQIPNPYDQNMDDLDLDDEFDTDDEE